MFQKWLQPTHANFLLRVVLSDTEICKLRLREKPGTVEQLNEAVRTALKIEYPFVILYEDCESMDDVEGFGPACHSIYALHVVCVSSTSS